MHRSASQYQVNIGHRPKVGRGADDQVVTEALNSAQELARLGSDVAVHKLVALVVENAQVHPLGVQIHAAIVSMLAVVESHHGPPW
jgi:hypothetical protein